VTTITRPKPKKKNVDSMLKNKSAQQHAIGR
jgi:hypothetical protein